MDFLQGLNRAMEALEKGLDAPLDYQALARTAGCSAYHLQRFFATVAGLPLAEYARRRRLSLAAEELREGARVLDTALKYGYDSPTAFTRAFKAQHGIAPSQARAEGATFKAYPRLFFHISIQGGEEMPFRVEKRPAFPIVGLRADLVNAAADALGQEALEENFRQVPLLWEKAAQEGLIPQMLGLMDGPVKGLLGVSACSPEQRHWHYYLAVSSGQQPPQGMETYTVPACDWAVFPGQGPMPGAVQQLEKRVVTQWLPTSGYEYADAPDIEVYLNADPANAAFEVWLPVKRADRGQ